VASYEDSETYKLAKQMAVEIHRTGSLQPERFRHFYAQYRKLGAMLFNLRQAVIDGRAT
jgi:hypothetical protein